MRALTRLLRPPTRSMAPAINPVDPRTFPRPPAIQSTPRKLEIRWPNDASPEGLIASTTAAVMVLETFHPPTYYIPRADIRATLHKDAAPKSFCEWKGMAVYYDVSKPSSGSGSGSGAGSGDRVRGRVWGYDDPSERFKSIENCLSFYADDNWECYVDGEKVEAQPGSFYGGWMTSDILRDSVKGAPGTTHW